MEPLFKQTQQDGIKVKLEAHSDLEPIFKQSRQEGSKVKLEADSDLEPLFKQSWQEGIEVKLEVDSDLEPLFKQTQKEIIKVKLEADSDLEPKSVSAKYLLLYLWHTHFAVNTADALEKYATTLLNLPNLVVKFGSCQTFLVILP